MVLVMLGLFLLLALSANKVRIFLKENITLTALMQLDAPESDVLALKAELENDSEIKEVIYTSKEAAAVELQAELGQDFINTLGYNPVTASLDLRFNSENANQQNLSDMKKYLAGKTIVREAFYQTDMLDIIEANAQKLLGGIAALGILFTIVAITLINSTIRLDLYSKRFIIRSMQLVGAKRWFIIRPFIGKAILNGIYGFVFAVLILGALLYILSTRIPDPQSLVSIIELGMVGGVILLVGLILTFVCSWLATRKYLRLKLEELY